MTTRQIMKIKKADWTIRMIVMAVAVAASPASAGCSGEERATLRFGGHGRNCIGLGDTKPISGRLRHWADQATSPTPAIVARSCLRFFSRSPGRASSPAT